MSGPERIRRSRSYSLPMVTIHSLAKGQFTNTFSDFYLFIVGFIILSGRSTVKAILGLFRRINE